MPKKKITPEMLDELLDVGFTQRQIESFHKEIYAVVKNNEMGLIEAIADYCEQRDIEPSTILPLISQDPKMLADISAEAHDKRLLKRSKRTQRLELE